MTSISERLMEKWDKEWTGITEATICWWFNAIADEVDALTGDEAADLYDAYENDNIAKWLRAQIQETQS